MLGLWGTVPLFVLNSLSFLGVAVAVATMRPPVLVPSPPELAPAAASPSPLGYVALLRRSDVALYAALTLSSSLLSVALLAVLVVRALDLGLGEGGTGVFIAVSALGALVGGVAAGGGSYTGRRAFTTAALASVVGTVGVVVFGVTGSVLVACAALLVTGLVGSLEDVASVTAFQNALPDGVYGRVSSLFLLAGSAGALLGGIVGPLLAERLEVGPSLVLLAIPDVVLALAFGRWAGTGRGFVRLAQPSRRPERAIGIESCSRAALASAS